MKLAQNVTQVFRGHVWKNVITVLGVSAGVALAIAVALSFIGQQKHSLELQHSLSQTIQDRDLFSASASALQVQIDALLQEDQVLKNKALLQEIMLLKKTYLSAVSAYEDLLDLQGLTTKTAAQEKLFATALALLAKDDVKGATDTLATLSASTKKELAKLAIVNIPANTVESNTAPSSGFSRQKVTIDGNAYLVDIIAGDLNSTKVVVDTASSSTCKNDCPVLSLGDYVARSGAYAGINGTYFCPESYPSCADKKNTFDVLVMNKDKTYFNSDNNVYSTVPIAIFRNGGSTFHSKTQDWGRDTGPDGVIANRPLLVLDGQNMFGGNDDAKESARGNRSFLGATGGTAYIGIVHGATVAEAAKVLVQLGVKNAINLDSGGSTALWSGGYKAGPGRNIPNAVLFVRR